MSYSFGVTAANKAEAKARVAAEYDKIVAGQSPHAKDRDQAQAAVNAFIDILDDDETKNVSLTVSGSLSGHWVGNDLTSFTGASLSIYANLATRSA